MSKIIDNLNSSELLDIEANCDSSFWKFLEEVFKEKEVQLLDAVILQGKDLNDLIKREQNLGAIKNLRTILVTIKNDVKQRRKPNE